MTDMHIPAGYREDAKGNLIPEANIKEVDIARDEFVREIFDRARTLHGVISRNKVDFLADFAAFCDLSAEKYGVSRGGEKGNVTLYSFDGRYKVVRAMAETLDFDERLQAARELINECMREWSDGANSNLRAVIESAFDLDRDSKLSASRILGLRRLKIDDPRWAKAMDAISESVQVTGSKAYVRFFERDANGKYQPVSLDLATA